MSMHVLKRGALLEITDANNERNIYVHPNPLARAIFWQRLICLHGLMVRQVATSSHVLDFGGGSGVFLPTLASSFSMIDIIDRDAQDARNIKAHFSLQNVTVIEKDILREHEPVPIYDAAVAADVLEHFESLAKPIRVLHQSLKSSGYLFVSLPTENALYRIGRKVVHKQKPIDHYHTADFVISQLEKGGFALQKSRYVPQLLLPLPLFRIAVLQKMEN